MNVSSSSSSCSSPSIVIVGGGPAGLALAAHLLDNGMTSCRVYERRSREQLLADTNSFYDMASSGIQALLRIAKGAAIPAIMEAAVAYDNVALYNGSNQHVVNLAWKGRTLGMPMFNITRAALLKALVEMVETLNPHCIQYDTNVKLLNPEEGTIEVSHGDVSTTTVVQADLIVAADGVHSRFRKQCMGDTGLRSDGIVACYATLPPLAKQTTAIKSNPPTPPPGLSSESYGILGMNSDLIQYAVVNTSATIWYANFALDGTPYVSVPPKPAHGWLQECKERCRRGNTTIPIMEELMEQTNEEDVQVVMCCDRDPLTTYHSGKVVLVGDAAHPFTPFAGLGSSQALVDAFCLGEALLRKEHSTSSTISGIDVNAAVQLYEEQRLESANALMGASRDLCDNSVGGRVKFCIFETVFRLGKLFGQQEAVAELFMTIDGNSMVNQLIPFSSEKNKIMYDHHLQTAMATLKAKV